MAKLTLSFKGSLLKVIQLKDGEMTIGRDPTCDIHIDSLAVQPVHSRLVTNNDKTLIKDCSSDDGTFVNHQRIDEVELADNDVIRIGKHVLRYIEANDVAIENQEENPETQQHAGETVEDSREGWLQILSGKHLGKTVRLKSGMTELAKHSLPPALVSHRSGTYYISTLGDDEINIGDTPIGEKSHPLQDGDMIQIGDTKVQFYLQ